MKRLRSIALWLVEFATLGEFPRGGARSSEQAGDHGGVVVPIEHGHKSGEVVPISRARSFKGQR